MSGVSDMPPKPFSIYFLDQEHPSLLVLGYFSNSLALHANLSRSSHTIRSLFRQHDARWKKKKKKEKKKKTHKSSSSGVSPVMVLSSDTGTGAEEAAALSEPPVEATAMPIVEIMVPRALFVAISRS